MLVKHLRKLSPTADRDLPEEVQGLMAKAEKKKIGLLHRRLHGDGRQRKVAASVRRQLSADMQQNAGDELAEGAWTASQASPRSAAAENPTQQAAPQAAAEQVASNFAAGGGILTRLAHPGSHSGQLPPLTARSGGRHSAHVVGGVEMVEGASAKAPGAQRAVTVEFCETHGNLAIGSRGGFALVGASASSTPRGRLFAPTTPSAGPRRAVTMGIF